MIQRILKLGWLLALAFAPWAAAVEDSAAHRIVMVEDNSNKLECLVWDRAGGAPLILLGGLGSTGHIFDGLAPRLAEKHPVVALTRRGVGASEAGSAQLDSSSLVEDILHCLDALQLDSVILVGHSFGCLEASLFAQRYPERVKAVVYLDGAYRPSVRRHELLARVGPLMPSPSPAEASSFPKLLNWMTENRPGWNAACETDLRSLLVIEGEAFRPRGNSQIFGLLMGVAKTTEPHFEKVRQPSLAIFADNGVLQLASGLPDARSADRSAFLDFAAFIKDARLEFEQSVPAGSTAHLDNTDHFCFIQREQMIAEMILEFAEKIGPSKAGGAQP